MRREFLIKFQTVAGRHVERRVKAEFARDAATLAIGQEPFPLTNWEPGLWRTDFVTPEGNWRAVWVREVV